MALVVVLVIAAVFYLRNRVNKQAEQISRTLAIPGTLPDLNVPVPSQVPTQLPLPLPGQLPVQVPPQSPAQAPVQTQGQATTQDTSQAPVAAGHVTSKDGQCALFTKAELSQVLEVNFARVKQDATGCEYRGDQRGEWMRVEILWTGGRAVLQQKREAYEHFAKTLTPANMPLHKAPGLGDEAYVNVINVFSVRRGDMAITLDLRYFENLPDAPKILVQRALARL